MRQTQMGYRGEGEGLPPWWWVRVMVGDLDTGFLGGCHNAWPLHVQLGMTEREEQHPLVWYESKFSL